MLCNFQRSLKIFTKTLENSVDTFILTLSTIDESDDDSNVKELSQDPRHHYRHPQAL